MPEIDFAGFAAEVTAFEAEYRQNQTASVSPASLKDGIEVVRNPTALCITSPQFLKLGFENQLDIVVNAFPTTVPHRRVSSSSELRDALIGAKVDIVHIAAFVCPRSGDLFFSDVDLRTGASASDQPDILTADALTALLKISDTKLVVIGSCDSIALAATLVTVCHVIAARDMISAKMMAAWVEAFYGMLPQRSLSDALDYADKFSRAPMRFYVRQTRTVDIVFKGQASFAIA